MMISFSTLNEVGLFKTKIIIKKANASNEISFVNC